jgi:hypothetical protein
MAPQPSKLLSELEEYLAKTGARFVTRVANVNRSPLGEAADKIDG